MTPTAILHRNQVRKRRGNGSVPRTPLKKAAFLPGSQDQVQLSARASRLARQPDSAASTIDEHRRLMGQVEKAYQPHLDALRLQSKAQQEVAPVLEPAERERFEASMAAETEDTAKPGRAAVDKMVTRFGQPGFAQDFQALSPSQQAELLTDAGQVFPDTDKGKEWVSSFVDGLTDPNKSNPFSSAAVKLMKSPDLTTQQRKKLEASLAWMVATDSSNRTAHGTALDTTRERDGFWTGAAISGTGHAANVGQALNLSPKLTRLFSAVGAATTLLGQGRSIMGGGMALVELASGNHSNEAWGDLLSNVGSGALAFGVSGGLAVMSGGLFLAGLAIKYGPDLMKRNPYHEFVEDHLMEASISEKKHRAVMTGFGRQGGLETVTNHAKRTGLEPWKVLNTAIAVRDQHHPRGSGTYYSGGGPWNFIYAGYGQMYYERALESLRRET